MHAWYWKKKNHLIPITKGVQLIAHLWSYKSTSQCTYTQVIISYSSNWAHVQPFFLCLLYTPTINFPFSPILVRIYDIISIYTRRDYCTAAYICIEFRETLIKYKIQYINHSWKSPRDIFIQMYCPATLIHNCIQTHYTHTVCIVLMTCVWIPYTYTQ